MSKPSIVWIGAGISSIALAVCLSCAPLAAQSESQADQQNAPPASIQQEPNDQGSPLAPPAQGPAQGASQANQAAPSRLTLSTGTVLAVRTIEQLSSEKNQVGDRFSATLEQPLVANGWVVARRGQIVTGRVVVAQKANHGGTSQLGVQLIELTLVDGQILPVNTQMTKSSTSPSTPPGRTVSTVGTTTVLGAIIGAAAGGGTGAAIGAGLGATAGGAVVLSTRGKPTILNSEALLAFRLEAPLEISTGQSQIAFQPVRQSDYSQGRDQDAYAQPRLKRGPYAGPAYYAPYPYLYDGGYYPVLPYVGFYGGYYGFYGPRFRGGFRGFRR